MSSLTRVDSPAHVCPDDPGGRGGRGGLTHHVHDLPHDPGLGGGAGDAGSPPEQDAGRATGQHGVTLGDGVTQVLTFRPLGNN